MDYKSLPASADQARKWVFYTTCRFFTIICGSFVDIRD